MRLHQPLNLLGIDQRSGVASPAPLRPTHSWCILTDTLPVILKAYFPNHIFDIFQETKQIVRLIFSEAFIETEGEILCNCETTPPAIVCALTRSLQTRNWECKQLWTLVIEICGPGQLSVASGSVFIGYSEAIHEFDIVVNIFVPQCSCC